MAARLDAAAHATLSVSNISTQASYRRASFWLDDLVERGIDDLRPREALSASARFDVALIGGGLTALWTAYELSCADPTLTIAVLERDIAGFGASGRNGGWCSALFPKSAAALERRHGFDAAVAMRRAMVDTVDEVGRVTMREGIDCDFERGGTLVFARDAVQRRGAEADVEEAKRFGVDRIEYRDERAMAATSGATALDGGSPSAGISHTSAPLHPAKLQRGLAQVVEDTGVNRIHGNQWRHVGAGGLR